MNIVGDGGGPTNIVEKSSAVHIIPVEHNNITEDFHFTTSTTSTLAVAANIGDTSIQLVSAAGFLVNDCIQITNGIMERGFPFITVIATNTLTLDRPLDSAYPIGTDINKLLVDLSGVVGTLLAPTSYKIQPDSNEDWYIYRVILVMTHSSAATDDKFGDLTALTNGIVLRANISGKFRTISNWKSNAGFRGDFFDVIFTDKAGNSLFGTSIKGSFSDVGITIRLNGGSGDYIELIVQDDITGLSSLRVKAQGFSEAA